VSETIFERKIYKEIKPYISTKDIIVIHGARQTGKTTLLKQLMKNLPHEDTCFFDLEDSRYLEICDEGIESIIAYLKQRGMLHDQKKFPVLELKRSLKIRWQDGL
jgi:predicted AAA+ superfamily ATPase